MEGQVIRIDYDAALEKAGVVESLADDVNTLLKDLVQNVESNIGNTSVWTGNSAADFKAAWDKCADDFDSYVNHIKTIRNQMEETHRQVSAFDNGTIASN